MAMTETITILGTAGSLRRDSYNRAALRAAQALAPTEATIDVFDLQGIPPFNQDDEQHPPGARGRPQDQDSGGGCHLDGDTGV